MALPHTPVTLYEGEQLQTICDAPMLVHFTRGSDSSKPLVVFVPGAYHLARIAYGGHSGYKSSDFLIHWFFESGHNFLALSYPVECTSAVMPTTRPDFTVREWGAPAEATKTIIDREGLLNQDVILLFWSMAGKILQPYMPEARKRGLNVQLAMSLVSTPALRGLRGGSSSILGTLASESGYAYSDNYKT